MYIPRALKKTFQSSLKLFPSVLITGPRQSGKTTFVQNTLKKAPYVTFDDPLNRDYALQDPNGFLDQFEEKPVILDEIQYVPELLQYIKIRIDRNKKNGTWILTGSQQFHLMNNINESLAGRVAIIELAPFSLTEIAKQNKDLAGIVWSGLFPDPCCFPEKRDLWTGSYMRTYIERDVRQLEAIKDYRSFEMFINLSAAFHSQEFHPAKLARDCGVSQPTIKSWSKILETSYLAIYLPPFYKNFGKRIIKAHKFYMADPSLVTYLTRQPSPEAALHGNMGGALFEGLMVSEVYKAFYNIGKKPSAYFWRSMGGIEVDLVIQAGGKLLPIEIKLTATPSAGHVKSIEKFKQIAGEDASDTGVIVCQTKQKQRLPGNNIALPWQAFSSWLIKTI